MSTDNVASETSAEQEEHSVDEAAANAAIAWASGEEPAGSGDESADYVADVESSDDNPTVKSDPAGAATAQITEEAVVALIAERDDYLEKLQRLKAEFANARRRADEQAATVSRRAEGDLVAKLLPVLDSAEAALGQGVEEVRPLSDALFEALASQGLTRLDPVGEAFDPELHEAVLFENGDGDDQVVVETMRLGYVWNDRVLRAAMVKVRG